MRIAKACANCLRAGGDHTAHYLARRRATTLGNGVDLALELLVYLLMLALVVIAVGVWL